MLHFISTGTYFKLLDLEIYGDLEILEMIGDDICKYIYIHSYVYIHIYSHIFSQCVSLVPLHLKCSRISIFGGQAIFCHINCFLNQAESVSLGFSLK